MAIACDEIFVVDRRQLRRIAPEVPRSGVRPDWGTDALGIAQGSGDRAEVFSTLAEGTEAKRARRGSD